MIKFSLEQVLVLHKLVINKSGGTMGLRDENLLISTINIAFQTINQKEIYLTDEEKIARITYGIIRNHPFLDGNKRIGILLMLILLKLSCIEIKFKQTELINIGMGLAMDNINYESLLKLIKTYAA